MRVLIVGLGIQGHKRQKIADKDVVAIVDPDHVAADFASIKDVPIEIFDAALVSTPDEVKFDILEYLLKNKKHVLVEKPLLSLDRDHLVHLQKLAKKNRVTCYTAYNHRFEPHFIRMRNLIADRSLGQLYTLRLSYGNGTARLVRESLWRDKGDGVLPDLGSHLLDTILYWVGKPSIDFKVTAASNFENNAFDHFVITSSSGILIQLEMSLLSWRNEFTADIYGEFGSAHIQSLCKWGPSTFTHRQRKLPSGRPNEEITQIIQDDPTWQAEYEYFKSLCEHGQSNLGNDIWINDILLSLSAQAAQEVSND